MKRFALIAAGALLGALMALSLTACGGSSSRDRISARVGCRFGPIAFLSVCAREGVSCDRRQEGSRGSCARGAAFDSRAISGLGTIACLGVLHVLYECRDGKRARCVPFSMSSVSALAMMSLSRVPRVFIVSCTAWTV